MLRTPIVSIALALSLSAVAAGQGLPGRPNAPGTPTRSLFGRAPGRSPAASPAVSSPHAGQPALPSPTPPGNAPAGAAAPVDDRTFRSGAVLPEPTQLDEGAAPAFTLPSEPIEPYLLQRHNGPFMVLAKTFRGPDAARYAQALAMELRSQYGLPAYVWYLRFQPGRSNIRNVPPTAPDYVRSGETVAAPERYRAHDEAAVLVGDCKTIDESEDLLHQVKKLHSAVLDGTPSLWNFNWRKGLGRAMLTTNPLRANQELFPSKDSGGETIAYGVPGAGGGPPHLAAGEAVDPYLLTAGFQYKEKDDPLIHQMNDPKVSARSLFNCPGPYALQVAEFLGRSTTDQSDSRFLSRDFLEMSPLKAAAEEAERLAESLNKCQTLPKGLQAYVFHDRHASRVLLGPIHQPGDPNLVKMVEHLNTQVSNELVKRRFTQLPLTPASQLTPVPKR